LSTKFCADYYNGHDLHPIAPCRILLNSFFFNLSWQEGHVQELHLRVPAIIFLPSIVMPEKAPTGVGQ
jgi:hypothetical protein